MNSDEPSTNSANNNSTLSNYANSSRSTKSRSSAESFKQPAKEGVEQHPYNEESIHKTILVGDSGVGKTSILVQFDQGKFQAGSFSATVGIGFTVSGRLVLLTLFCCRVMCRPGHAHLGVRAWPGKQSRE